MIQAKPIQLYKNNKPVGQPITIDRLAKITGKTYAQVWGMIRRKRLFNGCEMRRV